MKTRLIAAALAAAVLAAGCASTAQGQKFDDGFVAQIQKGRTTKGQVRSALGEPQTVQKSSGTETWIYSYSDAYGRGYVQAATFGLVKQKSDDQTLIVVFQGDVVADYTYTR